MRSWAADGERRASLPLPDREAVLAHASALMLDAWRGFDSPRPSQPPVGEGQLELLEAGLPEDPTDPRRALDEASEVLDVSLSQSRPRFFAWVGSSGLEIGVLGDALMASHDVNAAVESGGGDLLEDQVIRWIADFVGFGGAGEGVMCAGGQISNLTALAAARERAMPGFRSHGPEGRRGAIYTSVEAHHSIRRAAEVLGLGGENVRRIPIDGRRRMDVGACAAALASDRAEGIVPVAIVATAGTTLTGAVDDLAGLGALARRERVWLHVDGAYGLPAAATASAGSLFAGLDQADSATADAHKWLYVPKACSVLLMRDRADLANAFAHRESYMPHDSVEAHPVDHTLEYSRPLRALKLWLALRTHGAVAFRAAIERNLSQARLLAELIERDPRLELLLEPALSAVCFRFPPPPGADPRAHNALLCRAINEDGRIFLAAAEVDGTPCLRACIVNHRTTDDDVRAIPAVVTDIGMRAAATN